MVEIEISGRKIGDQFPPFIIAEVGINHEGEMSKAIQMVDSAVSAGADCVKFQCHITEAEMIPTDITPGDISDEPLWDIMKRCELTEEEERRLKKYCEEKGIIYLCTPFSREAADRLESLGVEAFKIGSGEANNVPLVEHIARKGKPIIMSTGMNDVESVRPSVDLIRGFGTPLMLMHCTSLYPTPYEKVRLGAITQLSEAFDVPIGFSDHSMGVYAPMGAIALGACAVEKHFTISRSWPGPDTSMSIEPDELAQLVEGSRAVFAARAGSKTVLPEEQPIIDFAFASVVTISPVKKGETFSLENTWVKRPGTGPIHARELSRVLSSLALKDLPADVQVKPGDIESW